MQSSNPRSKLTVFEAIDICLKKNLNFAAYQLPNAKNPEIVIQFDSELNYIAADELSAEIKGFLVTPFSDGDCCNAFLIKPDIYVKDYFSSEQEQQLIALSPQSIQSDASDMPEEITHSEYITQLDLILENICKGEFEKVVLSRIKIVAGEYISRLAQIYSDLCDSYHNALVYIFNAGEHLWMGASPEPLLKASNGTMHTVSLAGTRTYNELNTNIGAWNSKERLEQEYVTRYIAKVLSHFNLKDINQQGPYTQKAGNLLHLRTDFAFHSDEIMDKLGTFLSELHPTPAVCGMPRRESLELLRKLEKHKREFYSGFLGPVGLSGRLSLYVNLRCMKVLPGCLALFVGGGITADSVPEEEWHETEIKAETLLSVIKKIGNR